MIHEIGLEFAVRHASGRIESLVVDADRALIGTAAHCEVRLPVGTAAHEHIEIIAIAGVIHLSARGAPPLLGGIPFVAGPWPAGAPITIGNTEIAVRVVDLAPNQRKRSIVWALAPIPVIAAIVLFVSETMAPAASKTIPPAPPLLEPPAQACDAPVSPTLPAFAAERARIGMAKRERGPFSPRDSIEAVGMLEDAAACYQAASMPDDARAVHETATQLRSRLEEEYQIRRLRLEHAYRISDPYACKRELAVLLPLTAHRHGPYVDWLQSTDRYVSAAIDYRASHQLF